MAPAKAKTNDSSMKQKSLTSFFGKPSAAKAGSSQKPAAQSSGKPSSLNASKSQNPRTPESKGLHTLAPNSSAGASSKSSGGGSSVKQTPPTSDPIDVDMLSAEEEENERVQAKGVSNSASHDTNLLKLRVSLRLASNVKSLLTTRTTKTARCLLLDNRATSRHLPNLPLSKVC